MSYNMMIGYDIYDCFTMEHFRLRQKMTLTTKMYCSRLYILGIHDVFGTELAMIFSFPVGLTDSVMQRLQLFFCQCLFDILLPPHCQIYYFDIRKKVNDLLSVYK
jgi:hypothetical protein